MNVQNSHFVKKLGIEAIKPLVKKDARKIKLLEKNAAFLQCKKMRQFKNKCRSEKDFLRTNVLKHLIDNRYVSTEALYRALIPIREPT